MRFVAERFPQGYTVDCDNYVRKQKHYNYEDPLLSSVIDTYFQSPWRACRKILTSRQVDSLKDIYIL